jgi:hypothetical protein
MPATSLERSCIVISKRTNKEANFTGKGELVGQSKIGLLFADE